MSAEQHCYVAYLLRLWQITSEGEPVWRASLEDPRTGQHTGFADLEAMFTFLRQRAGVLPDAGGGEAEGE